MDPHQFFNRYGINLSDIKGNIPGERFSGFKLEDLRDHQSNPLNLSASFDPYSLLSAGDAKYIRGRAGNTSAWDTLILPLYDELFQDQDPGPVDPPPPPPPDDEPPIDPPPPVVVIPPPPVINISLFDLLDKFKLFSRIGLYRFSILKDVVKFAREYKVWRDEHWDQ